MGQRFQSVFILPPVEMESGGLNNAPNPNNRSEKVLVFHSQWLYGRRAININLAIMERLRKAINKRADCGIYGKNKKGFINHFLEKSLLNAINWASLQDLHNETNFQKSGEIVYSEEEKKPKENQLSLKELLQQQDNNNGFFICIINQDLSLSYAFLNGLEDGDKVELQTPKNYLNLFYSDKDLKEGGLYDKMQRQFKKFSNFKEIDRTTLKDVIEHLNKNKPNWA